jgi:signal transduction histidine kinase
VNYKKLILAAKAVGVTSYYYFKDDPRGLNIVGPKELTAEGTTWWNPYTDDGDAFRLMHAMCKYGSFGYIKSTCKKTTRKNIVYIASKIGKLS